MLLINQLVKVNNKDNNIKYQVLKVILLLQKYKYKIILNKIN